jgi:hypothetical protein
VPEPPLLPTDANWKLAAELPPGGDGARAFETPTTPNTLK